MKGKCDQIHNFSRVRSVYKGWFSITHISYIFLYQEEQETLLDMSGAPWRLYQSQFYREIEPVGDIYIPYIMITCYMIVAFSSTCWLGKSKVPSVDCKDRQVEALCESKLQSLGRASS